MRTILLSSAARLAGKRPGLAVSAAAHCAVLAALLLIATDRPAAPPDEETMEVDIVDAPGPARPVPAETVLPRPDPARQPDLARPDPAPPQSAPAVSEPAPAGHGSGTIRAARMLGARALAEPANRQIRQMMPTLALEERQRQFCAIEALAQIAAWKADFKPMRIVAYARAPLTVTAGRMIAHGAAVLGHGVWYALSFDCAYQPASGKVQDFEFEIGAPIPRAQWARLGLPGASRPLERGHGR